MPIDNNVYTIMVTCSSPETAQTAAVQIFTIPNVADIWASDNHLTVRLKVRSKEAAVIKAFKRVVTDATIIEMKSVSLMAWRRTDKTSWQSY
jgi:acetolactate synthase small subunit